MVQAAAQQEAIQHAAALVLLGVLRHALVSCSVHEVSRSCRIKEEGVTCLQPMHEPAPQTPLPLQSAAVLLSCCSSRTKTAVAGLRVLWLIHRHLGSLFSITSEFAAPSTYNHSICWSTTRWRYVLLCCHRGWLADAAKSCKWVVQTCQIAGTGGF